MWWEGSPWLPLATGVVFAALVVLHERVARARERARRAEGHYERGLRRIEDAWQGDAVRIGSGACAGDCVGQDLDLVGEGGLLALLAADRTSAGEEALRVRLLRPAGAAAIRERQEAVAELRGDLDLREDLAVLAGDPGAGAAPADLLRWGEAPPAPPAGGRLRAVASGVAGAVVLAAAVASAAGALGTGPLLAALAVGFAVHAAAGRGAREAIAAAETAEDSLAALRGILARCEAAPFRGAHLAALRGRLASGGMPASAAVASLSRRVGWFAVLRNPLTAPFAFALGLHVQAVAAVEAWRARHGAAIRGWWEALGEIEAAAALSGYAFEHPADPFPEIVEGPALFDGRGLGHPLVPDRGFVRNDVHLAAAPGAPALLLVSGSNMSGKSTLLRTVGVNAVLASCGAPVRAASLRMSPLAPGATLRVQDSLREGRSRFLAEIERLRVLLDRAAGPPPLLFLLDEVLAGTNSHDRRQGAAALLAALVERGAIGLATTHDLALSEAIRPLGPRARDVHFEDRLEGGNLVFDHRMRDGVVTRSNAVDLMRAVGLPVGDPPPPPGGASG